MSVQRQEQPVREVAIEAMRDERLTARQDLVVVEEPLEIRIAQAGETGPGTSISITMRTPGQDIELAVGFLHGEGIVRSREDIADSRICGPVGNVVRVQLTESAAHDPARLQRNFYTTSSCGVCGNASLAAVERMLRSPSVDASLKVTAGLIESLSERASFELLQKAAAAGIPVVAAVGAPSSLAIDLAQRTGILLVGFLRGHSFNVYAHGERLQ
jgi:FdhD protein